MKKKDLIIYLIILIFSITFLIVIISFLEEHNYSAFLWACYICLPIIIYGLFKRDANIILSQIIILAIPDLLWIFDFFYLIITGHVLIGATTFGGSLMDKIRSLQHLYVVPLSILVLSQIKIKKDYKILFIALEELILIYLLIRLFIPNSFNINCVYQNCINIPLNFLPYPVLWLILVPGFAVISYFIITSFPFIKNPNLRNFRKRN